MSQSGQTPTQIMEGALARRLRTQFYSLEGVSIVRGREGGVIISKNAAMVGLWRWNGSVFLFFKTVAGPSCGECRTISAAARYTVLHLDRAGAGEVPTESTLPSSRHTPEGE